MLRTKASKDLLNQLQAKQDNPRQLDDYQMSNVKQLGYKIIINLKV